MKKRLYTIIRIIIDILAFAVTAVIILDLCGVIDILAYYPHIIVDVLLFLLLVTLMHYRSLFSGASVRRQEPSASWRRKRNICAPSAKARM